MHVNCKSGFYRSFTSAHVRKHKREPDVVKMQSWSAYTLRSYQAVATRAAQINHIIQWQWLLWCKMNHSWLYRNISQNNCNISFWLYRAALIATRIFRGMAARTVISSERHQSSGHVVWQTSWNSLSLSELFLEHHSLPPVPARSAHPASEKTDWHHGLRLLSWPDYSQLMDYCVHVNWLIVVVPYCQTTEQLPPSGCETC